MKNKLDFRSVRYLRALAFVIALLLVLAPAYCYFDLRQSEKRLAVYLADRPPNQNRSIGVEKLVVESYRDVYFAKRRMAYLSHAVWYGPPLAIGVWMLASLHQKYLELESSAGAIAEQESTPSPLL